MTGPLPNIINAGLWALSAYDPALQPLVELRQKFAEQADQERLQISLDRLISTYLHHQTCQLAETAGATTRELQDATVKERIDEQELAWTLHQITGVDSDPLALEVASYAIALGAYTNWGSAPWRRYSRVVTDVYLHHLEAKQPLTTGATP